MPRSGEWSGQGGQPGEGMNIRGRCPGEDPGREGDSGAQHTLRSGCEEAKARAGGCGRGPAGGAPPGGEADLHGGASLLSEASSPSPAPTQPVPPPPSPRSSVGLTPPPPSPLGTVVPLGPSASPASGPRRPGRRGERREPGPPPAEGGAGPRRRRGARSGRGMERARRARERSPAAPEP